MAPASSGGHPPPVERVRAVIAYDGGAYHGFARNDPVPTVAGFLEDHLSHALGAPVRITGAGRTDRGVHARGQVVSFDAPAGRLDVRRLRRSIHSLSGGAIALRSAEVVAADFDARFSALWRRYRYVVRVDPVPDPFGRASTWWLGHDLDLDRMNAAAAHLVGEHDFSACCRRPKPVPGASTSPSLVRRVLDAQWSDAGDGLVGFEIRAAAFCHQMVRSIVGLLVDVGRGRVEPEAVVGVLASGDRAGVRTIAPPHGLTLWDVGYPDSEVPHLPLKTLGR